MGGFPAKVPLLSPSHYERSLAGRRVAVKTLTFRSGEATRKSGEGSAKENRLSTSYRSIYTPLSTTPYPAPFDSPRSSTAESG